MNISANHFAKDPAGSLNAEFHRMAGGKVSDLCEAIRAAQKLAGEIFSGNPGISSTNFHRKVNVDSFRDMEQIPGEAKIEPFDYGKDWQWRASKVFEEVEFYCLMTQAEYEEIQKAS